MKNPSTKFINRGSVALNRYFHHLFDDEITSNNGQPVPQVLPVQPVAQRKLFTKLAVEDHRSIFIQLNPLTPEGQITNCRGQLYPLPNKRFLLRNQNVSYIFTLKQVRYIAG